MRALVAGFPLPAGSTLNHGLIREFKGRLAALARERGYLDARFTEERLDVYVRENAPISHCDSTRAGATHSAK